MSLELNTTHCGSCEDLIPQIEPGSIACSVWSPPYHVGKEYERGQTFTEWQQMLRNVIGAHFSVLKPGGFMVVNIADILCYADERMPRIQLPNVARLKSKVTREDVLRAKNEHPDFNRDQLAELLGCSEQTVDRRLNGNNIRGGKYSTQTRVELVGSKIVSYSDLAGMFLYDRRIWRKDPTWANSKWHSSSYRSVDEFEYLYIFWKPGETEIDRDRLSRQEWSDWGSRAVWDIRSVSSNRDHEAMFPVELPRRCIQLLTEPNDVVLDPFMGSGTTGRAAVQLNREFIGIEKSEKYAKLANESTKFVDMDLLSTEFPVARGMIHGRKGNQQVRENH